MHLLGVLAIATGRPGDHGRNVPAAAVEVRNYAIEEYGMMMYLSVPDLKRVLQMMKVMKDKLAIQTVSTEGHFEHIILFTVHAIVLPEKQDHAANKVSC